MNLPTPKFFYFDLGCVLLEFDHETAVEQLARLGSLSTDRVREIVFASPLQQRYERGQIDTATFCQIFREQSGLSLKDAAICEAASDIFSPNRPVVHLLEQMHRADCQMGLLSNTCEAHWNWILGQGNVFLEHLVPKILSFQIGASKPEPLIYERAIQEVALPAEQIFFVDDLPENVAGAKACGIDAVLYTTAGDLREALIARNVNLST